MKKVISLLLVAIMVLAMVPAIAEDGITLTWVGAGWLQNDKAAKIIAKWEAIHPEIKVNYVDQGNTVDAAYLANLDTMVGSGTVIDVTYITYGEVYNRIINGGALALDEYIAAAGDDYEAMYGSLSTALLTYNGSVYGIPYAGNTFKVFYNKTMLDEKGITIPETWSLDEFRAIAAQLTDKENGIYGVTFPYGWQDIIYAPANLSGWFMAKYDAEGNVVPNFDDPTFKTVMQWAKDLADVDGSAPSLAIYTAEGINRRRTLATGQAAMIVDGPYTLVWFQNYMFNDPGEGPLTFELGVANLPYADENGKEVSYNTVAGAFYVPKTSAYPAEAYEFAKFLCNECPEEAANYMPIYKGADMAAATKSFTEYTDKQGVQHSDVYALDTAIAAVATPYEAYVGKYNYDPALAPYCSVLYTLFENNYALFLNGEMDLDTFVELMQEMGAEEIAAIQ